MTNPGKAKISSQNEKHLPGKKKHRKKSKKHLLEAEFLVALPPLCGKGRVTPLPLEELRLLHLLLVRMPPGLIQNAEAGNRAYKARPGKARQG